MGEAKRRKTLGLSPRTAQAPIRVRQTTLNLPVELAEKLDRLRPPQWALSEWLVGALAAFAEWAEQEKEQQESMSRIVQPYRTVPSKFPAGSLLGGRI